MKKLLLAAICLGICMPFSYAQEEDAVEPVKTKKLDHSIGLQMNELIRQVFNFSNTSVVTNNPYLLTYTVNLAKSGWGIRTGVGCVFKVLKTDDGISERVTNLNDVNARLGVEKRFNLSGKFTAGVGLDGVFNNNNDYTSSVIRSFDTTSTDTRSLITSYGGGAMGWLRYNISQKVLIGTEASFYYVSGKNKQVVTIKQRNEFGNNPRYITKTTKVDNKQANGSFSLPVVLYLIVSF